MKKITLFIFSLIISLVLFCGFFVKADATLTMVDGAQVRTAGEFQGLRFQASASTLEGVDEHGFYVALGNHTLDAMRAAIEGGEATVGGNKLVKKAASGEDTTFALTVYDISNTYYLTGITAVAYLKTGAVYTLDKAVTKNIAEVALKALNSGQSAALLTSVSEYVGANYYTVYENGLHKIEVNTGEKELNFELLGKEFLKDYNQKFSTSMTSFDEGHGSSSAFYLNARSTGGQNVYETGCKIYDFFQDDALFAKWGWLLNLLKEKASTSWGDKQIQIIKGEDSTAANWYFGAHIISSIVGFFTGTNYSTGYGGFNYPSKYNNVYPYVGTYNTTVYKDLSNSIVVASGETYTLPTIDAKTGYDITGWNDGSSNFAVGASYTVNAKKTLSTVYTPINYTVTYMDGSSDISASFAASKKSFTIESAEITLPNYEKDGYIFEGWYDNAGFAGDPIETIPAGSHESMVLYAKTTETSNVPVDITYNLNGGTWKKASVETLFTPTKTVNIDYYRTYQSSGYNVSLYHKKNVTYWYYITLQKTQYEDIYSIRQIVSGSANVTEDFDLVITWHDACTDATAKSTLMSIYNNKASYIGKFVVLDGIPAASATSTTSASIVAKFYNSISAGCNTTYTEETVLPTPVKPGYIFKGWKNSIDSNDYTTFPGYESDPGDITYTAQWQEAATLTVAAIRTQFLNDLNTVSGLSATAETFYSTYKEKLVVNSSGVTAGYIIENDAFRAKYMWLFEYAVNHGIHTAAAGNKYMAYAAATLGIEYYGTTEATTSDIRYSDRAFTNTLYNILNDEAITDKTLTESSSAVANPNAVSPYAGLIDAAQGAGFEIAAD
ncbi:MAG: InlB B-repeat-containing protein [Bacilli bacterium]|nr:InlB B-repeat-containing protein [Bacilli bacterium]